jgi:hypothetical protein
MVTMATRVSPGVQALGREADRATELPEPEACPEADCTNMGAADAAVAASRLTAGSATIRSAAPSSARR